jgi:tetratricopeptide (TPR) repeat protein
MWEFLRKHPLPGIGLVLGAFCTVGAYVMDALHLIELGPPAQIWQGIGAAVFFLSVMGILYQWWKTTSNNATASPSSTPSPVLHTDEKGNVKPPTTTTREPDKPETDSDGNHIIWLYRMEYAYRNGDDCLSTAAQYYAKLLANPGGIPLPMIEATYLLARFRCDAASGLSALKDLSGPRPDAYFANLVLGEYYESVGEHDAALKCLEDRYAHPTNMEQKLYSAFALAEFLTKTDNVEKALSFLTAQLSVFQSNDAHALIWEKLGTVYDLQKLEWRKQLCFEKSLTFNPDNTKIRFALAYSYGDSSYGHALAAHHYQIFTGTDSPKFHCVQQSVCDLRRNRRGRYEDCLVARSTAQKRQWLC